MKKSVIRNTLIMATMVAFTGCGGSSTENGIDIPVNVITLYAQNNGDAQVPTVQDYENLGVIGVNAENLATINAIVAGLNAENVDTREEVQALIADLGVSGVPVITLYGKAHQFLTINSTYKEYGAKAVDLEDGTIRVIKTGTVNTQKTGIYTLTYSATDSDNHTTKVLRKVEVTAITPVQSPSPSPTPNPTPNPVIVDNYGNTYLEVTSPTTGKVWLDRNLGATQVCTTATNAGCQGDLFQWGRPADGHQFSTAATTATPFTTIAPTATTDPVNYNKFFISNVNNSNYVKWTSADTTKTARKAFLADATTGKLCPVGYRVPTEIEWTAETTLTTGFTSFLKLPLTGRRTPDHGSFIAGNTNSIELWASETEISGLFLPRVVHIQPSPNLPVIYSNYHSVGEAIRCIKN